MATEYREAPSDRTPTKPDTTRICKVNTHSWRRTWCVGGCFFCCCWEKWYKWTKKERKKYQYYPKTGSFDLEKCRVVREIVKGPASKQGKRTRRKVTDNWRTDTQCTESTKLSQESGGLGREKKQEIPGFRSGVSNSNPNIWRWGGGAPGESCKPPPQSWEDCLPPVFLLETKWY